MLSTILGPHALAVVADIAFALFAFSIIWAAIKLSYQRVTGEPVPRNHLTIILDVLADLATNLPGAVNRLEHEYTGKGLFLSAPPLVQSNATPPPQAGRASFGAMLLCAIALPLLGAHCPITPGGGDGGAPSWTVGVTISVSVARAAVAEAEASEAETGFTGTDLTDYDTSLRLSDDALAALGDHAAAAARGQPLDPCVLHADAGRAVDALDRIGALLQAHNKPIPSTVLTSAGRVVGLLESALPPCASTSNGTTVLTARLRTRFGAALRVPAHAEDAR